MRKRLLPGLIFFLLSLWAIPALAQFGAIEGDVKDAEGKVFVGAEIALERTDMKGNFKTKTDKKGHYYYGGLPLGTFKVLVKQGDKILTYSEGIRVRPGDPTPVNFNLQNDQLRAQAVQAGVIAPNAPPGQDAPKLSKEQLAKLQEEQNKKAAARAKAEKLNSKFGSGMEALKAKNCDQAVTDLTESAELDPSQHVVYANLAEAYSCQSKTKSGDERTQAITKALEAYGKAIELKGDDASYHNNYGLALVNANKVAEAQAELTKAAQLDPTNAAKYYFNLGAVLTNTGKIDEAAEAFGMAIKADPNFAEAQYQLGIALMGKATLDPKTGKSTPAPGTIESFQKYLDIAPNGPNAETAKSMIQLLGGTQETQIKQKNTPTTPAKKKN